MLSKAVKWRFVVGFIALIAIISALIIVSQKAKQEPSYQGKPLTYWLQLYPDSPHRATLAIEAIGVDAMPWIISDLRATDTKLGVWLRHQRWFRWRSVPADIRHRQALMACRDLGTNARLALPDLEQLLPKQSDELNVTSTIARTGVEGTLMLLRSFTNVSYSPSIKAAIIGTLQLTYLSPNSPIRPAQ